MLRGSNLANKLIVNMIYLTIFNRLYLPQSASSVERNFAPPSSRGRVHVNRTGRARVTSVDGSCKDSASVSFALRIEITNPCWNNDGECLKTIRFCFTPTHMLSQWIAAVILTVNLENDGDFNTARRWESARECVSPASRDALLVFTSKHQ